MSLQVLSLSLLCPLTRDAEDTCLSRLASADSLLLEQLRTRAAMINPALAEWLDAREAEA